MFVGLIVLAAQGARSAGSGHSAFATSIEKGLTAGGKTVKIPPPTFHDGQAADEQRAELRRVAGSDRKMEEMLADSVAAPYVLKLNDLVADGTTLRSIDLWFILHVGLDAIKADDPLRRADSGPIEAGNMRFEAKALTADDLKPDGVGPPAEGEAYSHSTGRLLDRILVESTDRIVVSRTPDSILVAGGTDPRFGPESRSPNRWSTIAWSGTSEKRGPAQPYLGSVGYAKITRWKGSLKTVVVETHFAFAEPKGWFAGAPILRSKFNLIAQDQIRAIRRELAKSLTKP